MGRQRHLYDAFCLFIDAFQQIQIPQDPVGFRLDRQTKSVTVDEFQTPSGQLQFFFAMHIRVGHCSGADHTLAPLGAKGSLQQFRRVLLHFDVLERMGESVALAPGIAINAAMGTAAVQIHSVLGR